jgi:hypothetical protein
MQQAAITVPIGYWLVATKLRRTIQAPIAA